MSARRNWALAATALSALPIVAPFAAAQEVGEVIVTAQRREENLQEVPIAIATFSADELSRSGISSGLDLTTRVTGLYYGRSAAYAIPFLRGVGTNNVTAGDESSVATYIDGVYSPSLVGNALQFNNILRVEVLKGPQGTLFGRNATGGLLNIVTRTPGQDFAYDVSVGYDNFDTLESATYVGGGLADNLAADLALYVRDQGRPTRFNAATGSRVGEDSSFAARSKWVWTPTTRLTLTGSVDYSEAVATNNTVRDIFPGTVPLAALAGGIYDANPEVVHNSYNPTSDLQQYGASLRIDAEFNAFDFVSITAYRYSEYLNVLETDATTADGVGSVTHPTLGVQSLPTLGFYSPLSEPNFLSQELQLLSNGDGPFSWIVGAYLVSNESSYDGFRILSGQNTTVGSPTFTTLETTAAAGFAQGTYDFGQLSLTAGVRLNYDRRGYEGRSGATTTDVESDWTEPTWRLAANYQATDDLMLYGSYSRGYKSGLYNINTITARTPVNPEILDAVEIGFKSDLFGNRMRLNGAAFRYDYQDLQYQALAPGGGASILQNAAAATIEGAELDLQAFITEHLQVFGGVAYLDARYDSFPAAQVYRPAPPAGNATLFLDVGGRQMIRAPDWTFNAGAELEIPLGDAASLVMNGTYFWSDSFPFEPSGRLQQSSYEYLNASATLWNADETRALQLWVNNAFDELYLTNVSPSGRGDTVAYANPRTYGLRIRFRN